MIEGIILASLEGTNQTSIAYSFIILGLLAAVLLAAAEGLVVMSIAAKTFISGLGTVLASTIHLLGVLLFSVALAFIVV